MIIFLNDNVYLLKYEIVSFIVMTENQLFSIVYLGPSSDWYHIHYLVSELIIFLNSFDLLIEIWNSLINFYDRKQINFNGLSSYQFRLIIYSLFGICIDYFRKWNCFYWYMKLFIYCYDRKPINSDSLSSLQFRLTLYS